MPVVSTLLDAATVITGKNPITGEGASRLVALAGLVSPAGGGQLRAAGNLAEGVADNLKRFQKNLPNGAGETVVRDLPMGGKAFQAEVPASNIPGSKAVYEKQVDANGKTLEYTKTTYAPGGDIVHVKDKIRGTTIRPE